MKKAGEQQTCSKILNIAEIKLLIILLYFILISIIVLVVESFPTSVTPKLYLSALLPYFTCESTGVHEGKDCESLLPYETQLHFYKLLVVSMIFSRLLPAILFLFSIDFKLCVKWKIAK